MKIKPLLFLFLIIMLIFLIYKKTEDKEIYYLNIDLSNSNKYDKYIINYKKLEKYVKYPNKDNYRTTDLIKDIKENKKIKNQTLTNALIKADILTIYIGINDINYKIGYTDKEEIYEYVDEMMDDVDNLLKIIRKYCKEKIYLISIKNEIGISYNDMFNYINNRLKNISKRYNIKYLDINSNVGKQIINDIY